MSASPPYSRAIIRRAAQSYDVTSWLKNREAQETLENYARMLRGRTRLREEFAEIYHDKYGKTYGMPRELIHELLES